MFNRKSIYALNKKDPDAIVYMDANEVIVRLTREDFASEEEFLKWKSWSDGNYHTEDNQDVVEGKHNEYFDYKEKYESRIADLSVEMEQLEDGLRTIDTQIEQHRALEQDAAQIKTDCALTGALIERLIDRIEVSHDKQITVRYRFQSEFETYAEVLEQCRNM